MPRTSERVTITQDDESVTPGLEKSPIEKDKTKARWVPDSLEWRHPSSGKRTHSDSIQNVDGREMMRGLSSSGKRDTLRSRYLPARGLSL